MQSNKSLFSGNSENACSTYRYILDSKNSSDRAGREHCEELWNEYRSFADPNFLEEFSLHTHQRWFEMYLTVSLIRAGLNVECSKLKKRGAPDVLITDDDRKIWIEAVCPTAGTEGKPDSVPSYSAHGENPVAKYVPQNQIVMRLLSSLKDKSCKYKHYRDCGVVDKDDVLAVAINVHDIPYACLDNEENSMPDPMMTGLYGLGNPCVSVDRNTMEVVDYHNTQLCSIKKSSGKKIGVQPFIDGSMPQISAVLKSRSDMVNLPQHLGDDLVLFPNLSCKTAWTECSIKLGKEWVFREIDGEWKGRILDHRERKL